MVFVPKRLYATELVPPTCNVCVKKPYEADDVPATSNTVLGALPIPMLKPALWM